MLTGGNRVIFEVGSRLANRGHDVTITSLGRSNHHWFSLGEMEVKYPELKFLIYVPTKGKIPIRDLCNWFFGKVNGPYEIDPVRLLALSTPNDVDINVATFCFTAYAVYRSAKGIPFYYIQHFEPLFFSLDTYLCQKARETYHLPLEWVVNSSWVNEKLRDTVGRKGPIIVPGVDTSVFFPREIEKKGDKKVVIALGKGDKIKGLKYLFKALEIIREKCSLRLELVLYGNEPHLARLSPIPTKYVVKPSDEELAKLYSTADVAVTSSLYESSPLPPLEAMGCGTPIVTTRYGTEDYCIDEVNCLVTPPQDSKNLAKVILKILEDNDLAEKLVKDGLKTATQLTWERTTEKVEKTFKQALEDKQ